MTKPSGTSGFSRASLRGKLARGALALFALSLCSSPFARAAAPSFSPEQVEFFRAKVQPILKARCLKCHGGEAKVRGGFRVDSRESMLKGGELGPAVTPETPEESLLLQAINYDGIEMPPSGRLPKEEVETLTRWVKMGTPWTPGGKAPVVEAKADSQADSPEKHRDRDDAHKLVRMYLPSEMSGHTMP